jgi:2-dehydropantoate 2-reductase
MEQVAMEEPWTPRDQAIQEQPNQLMSEQPNINQPDIDPPSSPSPKADPTTAPTEHPPRLQPADWATVSTVESDNGLGYESMPLYKHVLARMRFQDKIHILGFTQTSRFIAHCLARTPRLPPTQLLVHDPKVIVQWYAEQKRITLYNPEGLAMSQTIASPENIMTPGRARSDPDFWIHNLIVDADVTTACNSLSRICRRINAGTVVCLVNGGLGLIERLNATVFPDPFRRPTYVLGQTTHRIGLKPNYDGQMYSIKLREAGKLYLTVANSPAIYGQGSEQTDAATKAETERAVGSVKMMQRHARAAHMLQLLQLTPGLEVEVRQMAPFLRHKLAVMVFSAATDAVSVILRCTFEDIHNLPQPRSLWNRMVRETIGIITSLPEFQADPAIAKFFQQFSFRQRMLWHLTRQRGTSRWVKRLRDGQDVGIRHLNGYFVERALETGVAHELNAMAVSVVNARRAMAQLDMRGDIPMYHYTEEEDVYGAEEGSPTQTKYVYLPPAQRG